MENIKAELKLDFCLMEYLTAEFSYDDIDELHQRMVAVELVKDMPIEKLRELITFSQKGIVEFKGHIFQEINKSSLREYMAIGEKQPTHIIHTATLKLKEK